MKQIRALLNPIHFPGFHTLLRGESCDVPDGFEDRCQGLVDRGSCEWVDVSAPARDKTPDPASAEVPPATEPPPEETPEELEARLRKELAELEAQEGEIDVDATLAGPPADPEQPAESEPPPPVDGAPAPRVTSKPAVPCVHCGKIYTDHAKKPRDAIEGVVCKGLRRGFVPPAASA